MTEQWLNTDSITADLDTLSDFNQSRSQDDLPLRPVIDRPAAIQVKEDSDYNLLFGDDNAQDEENDLSEPNLTSIVQMLRTYAPDYRNSLIEETYKPDLNENGEDKCEKILELTKANATAQLNLEGKVASNLNPDAPEFVSTNISLGSLIKRKLQRDIVDKKIVPEDNKKKNKRNVAICSLLDTLADAKKECDNDIKISDALPVQKIDAKVEKLSELKNSQDNCPKEVIDRCEISEISKENTSASTSPLSAMKLNRVKEWVQDPHSFSKSDMKKERRKFHLDNPIGFTSKKVSSLDSMPENQSANADSGTSSPSLAPQVIEYVQTENCEALYLKYQQRAQLRQTQKEDIWTRTERELKKRDEEILRKRQEENLKNLSNSSAENV